MNSKIKILTLLTGVVLLVISCYKNKEDILSLPKVSFRGEVVPIITSGACGCHNNGSIRQIVFSHGDTIFYDAILARTSLFKAWVNGGTHPGGGNVDFTPTQRLIVKEWIDQGAQDDAGGCTVTGAITYTAKINPIYTTSCKGPNCHGGIAITQTYATMVADKNILSAMMNSGGSSGHPGGALSLSSCTINIFKAWIDQGQPQ
jgi:hypothetical protein